MEGERHRRSLGLIKPSAAFERRWFSVNLSSEPGFDSSLPRNHTRHVALAGILNNEWSYWMAHASPQLHVFNYPNVSVTKMTFSSLAGLLMTEDSSVVTSQNSFYQQKFWWIWVEALRFSRLHSLSPSLAPKYGSHFKAFVCREGGGERKGGRGGRGLIYLNNLVVMKAAWAPWRWRDG